MGNEVSRFMSRMSGLLLAGALAFGGCAWTSHQLLAPEGYNLNRRLQAMQQCKLQASRAMGSGTAPLSNQEKAPLQGRATQRFLDRGEPVLDQEGNPAAWQSPFRVYLSSDLSDRYVLCLLGRGYRWDDSPPPLFLIAPPDRFSTPVPPARSP